MVARVQRKAGLPIGPSSRSCLAQSYEVGELRTASGELPYLATPTTKKLSRCSLRHLVPRVLAVEAMTLENPFTIELKEPLTDVLLRLQAGDEFAQAQ